mgnify:FL=1
MKFTRCCQKQHALSDYYNKWQLMIVQPILCRWLNWSQLYRPSVCSSLCWEEIRVCENESLCGKIKRQNHEIDDRTARPAVHQWYIPKREGNFSLQFHYIRHIHHKQSTQALIQQNFQVYLGTIITFQHGSPANTSLWVRSHNSVLQLQRNCRV